MGPMTDENAQLGGGSEGSGLGHMGREGRQAKKGDLWGPRQMKIHN